MNLAENLKRIRKEHNLSQEQLAEQLGVSRQSVSKWESGQAYPEMDKVLQLAKMFNLNIDDLLNQDIKEVNIEKQSKIAINKYIDDFLGFITKTVDMFCSMKFKDKVKCLFEQFVVGCLLFILFIIVGAICSEVLYGLLSIFPYQITNIIYSICSSIYSIFSLVLGIILLIHIFKVRYLDYYVIVREKEEIIEDSTKEVIEENQKSKKIYLEKKREEIVIRDPKHSGYRFISGVLKCLLFFVKAFTLFIAFVFCMSLIGFVMSFIITFLIVQTGLFFLGLALAIVSCIVINIIILFILFNFIIGKKTNGKMLLVVFIVSIVLFGVGIGIGFIGFTNFNYIDDINNTDIYLEEEFTIPMQDDLIIDDYDIQYVIEDRSDIKVVYKHTNFFDLSHDITDDNYLYFDVINKHSNFFKIMRESIKDINNKQIINYSNFSIYIYTSEDNINRLKVNRDNYIKELQNDRCYYGE